MIWRVILFCLLGVVSALGNLPRHFIYDGNNRLTNVTDWANRRTVYAYDLAGHLVSVRRPNNTLRVMAYDDDGELTNIVERATSQFPIAFDTLNYNLAGRVQWEFKGPLPHANTPPARTNTFDADNRLATFNGAAVTVDADGNLSHGPLTNSTFETYAYDPRNRLTSAGGITYGYDPANDRVALTNGANIATYVIDAASSQVLMQVKAQIITNTVYAETLEPGIASIEVQGPLPLGFRVGSGFAVSGLTSPLAILNGTWTCGAMENIGGNDYVVAYLLSYGGGQQFYLQQGSFMAPSPSSAVTHYYIYGNGLLYEIDESATATNLVYYHFDSRGSTVALTDANGNVTDQIEYSPYGMTTYRTGTNNTPFLYNGQFGVQTDPNGLLYMRARYYNPYLCRFINADPSGFGGGLNFYAFADGNPVSETDPFGLDVTDLNVAPPLSMAINPNVFPAQQAIQAPGSPTYQPEQPYFNPDFASTFTSQNLSDLNTARDVFQVGAIAAVMTAQTVAGNYLGDVLLADAAEETAAAGDHPDGNQ